MKDLFDSNSGFKQQLNGITNLFTGTFESIQNYALFVLLQFVTNYEGLIAVVYTLSQLV